MSNLQNKINDSNSNSWSEILVDTPEKLYNLNTLSKTERFGNYKANLFGFTFYCNDLAALYTSFKDIFLNKVYEFNTEKLNPFVIDGGGHIGVFAVFVKYRFPDAEIIVFEPEQKHCELIRKNLEANNCSSKVTIIQAGLHDYEGTSAFSKNTVGSHITNNVLEGENTIRVTTLDKYSNQTINFLKLNIEGTELEVLKSLGSRLQNVEQVAIEYHGFPELGQRLHQILEIMDMNGMRYLVHDFDDHTNPSTKPPFNINSDTRFYLLVYGRRILPIKKIEKEKATLSIEPRSRVFGLDLGTSICRVYIDQFLAPYRSLVTGKVMEIGESRYTNQFGTSPFESYIVSADPNHMNAIQGDLATGKNIPVNFFDCIILTQTLQVIFDVRSALKHTIASLRPGGVLLLTATGIAQISCYDRDRWGEYWRFTVQCMQELLHEAAPAKAEITVKSYGNLITTTGYLNGDPAEDISPEHFIQNDPDYPMLICAYLRMPGDK